MGMGGQQVRWAFRSAGLLRAQARSHTTVQHQPLPATLPARGAMGDTKEWPNTALQGLKMQHPKQGLKMQSWGWAGAERCRPNHRGCQSGILPLPSSVFGGRSDSSD